MDIVIIADRERYPGFAPELPDRITISASDYASVVAERIREMLQDHFVAGSGCDDFYALEGVDAD